MSDRRTLRLPGNRASGFLLCGALVLCFIVLALLGFRRGEQQSRSLRRQWNPRCGAFSRWDQETLRIISRDQTVTDKVFREQLNRYVGSSLVEPDRKYSATRIRLQCGLINSAEEIPEAAALQLVNAGVVLDVGTAPPIADASYRSVAEGDIGAFRSKGRFDVVRMLTYQLRRPRSDPPSEFDASRDIAALVADQVRDFRDRHGSEF